MKGIRLRISIYIIVFIVAAVLTYIFCISDFIKEESTSTMNGAHLPVVYMLTEEGVPYNYLHGYTADMDITSLHGVVTPIGTDRSLSFEIRQYECVVSGISYEVRSMDGEELLERTAVSDYESEKGTISLDVRFKNLLEAGKEYMLMITVSSENYGDIVFYSRLMMSDNANLDRKIAYVKWFSDCTRSENSLNDIAAKLETDRTGDNTDFGFVNIHCSLSHVGYGAIKPALASSYYIEVNEISGNYASITLRYRLETSDEEGSHAYNVREFFRINQIDENVTYVNTYNRYMDQIIDVKQTLDASGKLYLGILSDTDLEMTCSPNGYVTCFVKDRTLYSYSASKNRFTKVFTFSDERSDGIREDYDQHDIKILSVDNSGNIRFLVYGYMNRGAHEGMCGVGAYEYLAETTTVEELAFIPENEPYQILEKSLEKVFYINENNILYFYRNHSIYYLNYITKECMFVAGNVLAESCITNGNLLVYETGNDLYDCTQINVLNMDDGRLDTITCEKDLRLMALGFIDENLVYGVADADMVMSDINGQTIFPMKEIILVDETLTTVKEYSKENYYIMDVAFYKAKISITRAVMNEDGNFVITDTDELLSNAEQNDYAAALTDSTSELRKKEWYLKFPIAGLGAAAVQTVKYTFPSDAVVSVDRGTEQDTGYYKVYGDGIFVSATLNLTEAVSYADQIAGVVVDKNGETIWTRYKDTASTIVLPDAQPYLAGEGGDTGQAAMELLYAVTGASKDAELYDLTGCTIELTEYFINQGSPIVARIGEDDYTLVYGYTASNVLTIDMAAGEQVTYSLKDFNALIQKYGTVLMTAVAGK